MAYVKKKRKPAGNPVLETWAQLNAKVTKLSEAQCEALIKVEAKHRNRKQFLGRLLSRLARVRRQRERKELGK